MLLGKCKSVSLLFLISILLNCSAKAESNFGDYLEITLLTNKIELKDTVGVKLLSDNLPLFNNTFLGNKQKEESSFSIFKIINLSNFKDAKDAKLYAKPNGFIYEDRVTFQVFEIRIVNHNNEQRRYKVDGLILGEDGKPGLLGHPILSKISPEHPYETSVVIFAGRKGNAVISSIKEEKLIFAPM